MTEFEILVQTAARTKQAAREARKVQSVATDIAFNADEEERKAENALYNFVSAQVSQISSPD